MPQQEHVYCTDLTPLSFLRRSAYLYPDKTAVVHGERRYSYRQLEERVGRLAARLRADGLQKQDRVAFLSPEHPAAAGGALARGRRRRAGGDQHPPRLA